MYYDVQSKLILFANALWERVKPACAGIKNGEIVLKLRTSYINASKHALILQFVKMSLGFGNLWDHLWYVLSRTHMSWNSIFY